APTADRNFRNELRVQFGIFENWLVQLSRKGTGTDTVHGDLFECQFQSKRLGKTQEPELAGGVSRASANGDVAHDGSHIQDAPVALPFHVWNEGATHEKGGGKTCIHDL